MLVCHLIGQWGKEVPHCPCFPSKLSIASLQVTRQRWKVINAPAHAGAWDSFKMWGQPPGRCWWRREWFYGLLNWSAQEHWKETPNTGQKTKANLVTNWTSKRRRVCGSSYSCLCGEGLQWKKQKLSEPCCMECSSRICKPRTGKLPPVFLTCQLQKPWHNYCCSLKTPVIKQ